MKARVLLVVALCGSLAVAQDDRLSLARKLSGAGQYPQAISEYQKALEKTPGQAQVWTELAEARMSAGQYQGAVSDFSRAVRLEPTNQRAQKGLALACEKSGNQQRALLEWRRVAQLAQGAEQAEAETRVDQIMAALGGAPVSKPVDTSKAAPAPHKAPPTSAPAKVKAEESDPADVKKAVEAWKEGKRDKALETLRGIIKKKPTTEAYYYAGVMRFEEKKYDMAEFNLKKAIGDKELGGSAWYWLGRTQDERKKPKEAKESFKKSLELSPKGEFANEAKARLEPEPAKPSHDTAKAVAAHVTETVKPEIAPPLLPDSLRGLYSWTAPDLKIPSGDGSAAGKLLDDAAKQMAARQNDLALSSLDQIKLKESAAPAADLVALASAVVYNAMGLSSNALGQLEGFLKDHANHPQADYAKYVLGVSLLRTGKFDSAAKVLGPLPIATKNSLWTEANRQSALGEALRLSGKPSEALAALRLAFQAETDVKIRRNIALRMAREAAKANTPDQALVPLSQIRRTCDKSNSCLQVQVTEADLLWNSGKPQEAAPLYADIVKNWPRSTEAPWAMYQSGNVLQKQGKGDLAAADWKSVMEKYPGSYWAGQARLRLEDAVWRTRYKATK